MSYVRAVLSAVPFLNREWSKKQRLLLQNAVRNTLPKHRAAACMRHRLGSSGVSVSANAIQGLTRLGGLMVCDASHICPMCHHKKMSQEKSVVAEIVASHYAAGYWMVDAVLTVPHSVGESLSVVLARLESVWKNLRSKIIWRELSEYLGIVGSIRKLEVTLTENGWHPHYHVSFLCGSGTGLKGHTRYAVLSDAHAQVAGAWARAGERTGIKVSLLAQAAVTIVAGVSAQKAVEYTIKNMGYGYKKNSLTPMDLLRVIDQSADDTVAVHAAKRLFSEYASAIKGKHTVSFLGSARLSKAEIANHTEAEDTKDTYVRLGTVSAECWRAVVSVLGLREQIAEVMTCAELTQAVSRAAEFAGFADIPPGWLTLLMPVETKTVIKVKSSSSDSLAYPSREYALRV